MTKKSVIKKNMSSSTTDDILLVDEFSTEGDSSNEESPQETLSNTEQQMPQVKIQVLNKKAVIPTRANPSDTGYDLTFIAVDAIVSDTIFFKTGISMAPPPGYYFEVVPRSSISKLPLMMANSIGVIDEHYRGEIIVPVKVLHQNLGQAKERDSMPGGIVSIFGMKPSSMSDVANQILTNKPKLFQLILRQRLDAEFQVVDRLETTERGTGGFGSSDLTSK